MFKLHLIKDWLHMTNHKTSCLISYSLSTWVCCYNCWLLAIGLLHKINVMQRRQQLLIKRKLLLCTHLHASQAFSFNIPHKVVQCVRKVIYKQIQPQWKKEHDVAFYNDMEKESLIMWKQFFLISVELTFLCN